MVCSMTVSALMVDLRGVAIIEVRDCGTKREMIACHEVRNGYDKQCLTDALREEY